MLPARWNPISVLIEDKRPYGHSINLTRMGGLYIVAALFQCTWPYFILTNWSEAELFLDIAILGWAFAVIWIMMVWLVLHLIFIGVRLIQLSRDPTVTIRQSKWDKRQTRQIALLLVLGVMVDALTFPLALAAEDEGWGIFFSVLMGGRVVQANLEAVLQYHRM